MSYTISDVARSHVAAMLTEVYTALPAIVDKYYPDTQQIDCTVAIKKPVNSTEVVEPAVIKDVQVVFPAGSDWVVSGKLKKGDAVLLVMSMVSIDEYMGLTKDQIATPTNFRYHDINDCFAIVGVTTPKSPAVKRSLIDADFSIAQGENAENNLQMSTTEGLTVSSDTTVNLKVGTTTSAVITEGNVNITVGGTNFTVTDGTVNTNANIVTTGTVTCSDLITPTNSTYIGHTHNYTDNGNSLVTAVPNP